MRVLYFAWLRERLGKASEDLALPDNIKTPRAMIHWLRSLSPAYAQAFADETLIRCAIDQEFHSLDKVLEDAAEIAFFPPVTGG